MAAQSLFAQYWNGAPTGGAPAPNTGILKQNPMLSTGMGMNESAKPPSPMAAYQNPGISNPWGIGPDGSGGPGSAPSRPGGPPVKPGGPPSPPVPGAPAGGAAPGSAGAYGSGNEFSTPSDLGQGDVLRNQYNGITAGENYRAGQERTFGDMYKTALQNPAQTAGMFNQFYQQAAQGLTSQAMKDYTTQANNTTGAIAQRYGGKPSTAEEKGQYDLADVFTRNLNAQLAALATQGVNAGANYTNQLGQAAGQSAGASSTEQGLGVSLGQPPNQGGGSNTLGTILGTGLGVAGLFL